MDSEVVHSPTSGVSMVLEQEVAFLAPRVPTSCTSPTSDDTMVLHKHGPKHSAPCPSPRCLSPRCPSPRFSTSVYGKSRPMSKSKKWKKSKKRRESMSARRDGEDDSEGTWSRRIQHREAGVQAIWRSSDYQIVTEMGLGPRLVSTPDPRDRILSKRVWETGVQNWRKDLQRLVNDRVDAVKGNHHATIEQ